MTRHAEGETAFDCQESTPRLREDAQARHVEAEGSEDRQRWQDEGRATAHGKKGSTNKKKTPPQELTKDAHRVLVNYIRDLADAMGLKDWQFSVEPFRPNEENDGYIARTHVWGNDSRTATIWVSVHFFKYGPRQQRETLVHELVHWHTDKLFQSAKDIMSNNLGHEAERIAVNMLKRMHEMTVDGIAAAWAREFPLIDWSDKRPIYSGYEADTDDRPIADD